MRRALTLLVAGAALLLPACSGSGVDARWKHESGATVEYVAERDDTWENGLVGYGGTLSTRTHLTALCTDGRADRARWDVRATRLVVDAPDRFGVEFDTSAPSFDDDAHALARGLLDRARPVVLDRFAGPLSVPEPDEELRGALAAWERGRELERARPVVRLLDESLDAPRVLAAWLELPAAVLAAAHGEQDGAVVHVTLPPVQTSVGAITADLALAVRVQPGRLSVEGEGPVRAVDSAAGRGRGGVRGGTARVQLEFDTSAGRLTRSKQVVDAVLAGPDDRDMPVTWRRGLEAVAPR